MENIMLRLRQCFFNEPSCNDENQLIDSLCLQMRAALDKEQKRLLLKILDSKDAICERTSLEAITYGFKLAMEIQNSIYFKDEDLSEGGLSFRPLPSSQESYEGR